MSFNSKLVRLKEKRQMKVSVKSSSFNSKLVRLKGYSRIEKMKWINRFQFQTGSIKRERERRNKRVEIQCFNSKLVRLKVETDLAYPENVFECFNSKLVRLKGGHRCKACRKGAWFQFQTGSIKSRHSFFKFY